MDASPFPDFGAIPLPEVPAPAWVDRFTLCATVSAEPRLVWGEGKEDAPLLIILDQPGARERSDGTPYVCGTRQTLRQAMHVARVHPDELFVTFLLKCRPRRKYDREKAFPLFLPILIRQVKDGKFQRILAMGDRVTSSLLGGKSVKETRGRWHHWTGLPMRTAYHPLAARRRPALFPLLVTDLRAVQCSEPPPYIHHNQFQ